MDKIVHFFKLIRIQNLLIIAATQYAIRFLIIYPILFISELQLQFSEFNFLLLVLSTVFLTAAGYVINDYFDTKTDMINRPETVIIGKYLSRRSAIILHFVLSGIGVILGAYISYKIELLRLAFIYLMIAGLLWYYSTTYKRQFLIGNIIVAILTAIVPFMVVLYEIPMLNRAYAEILIENNANFSILFIWAGGFSFFAFMTTLFREIIKDVEDFHGDKAFGRNTLPIKIGDFNTKIVIIALVSITIAAVYLSYFLYLQDIISLIYMSAGLVLPMLFIIYKIFTAKEKKDYRLASTMSKIVMLLGIAYAFVAYYNFTS